MRYLNEVMTGQLILVTPTRRRPVTTTALVAKSPAPVDGFIIRLVLFVFSLFRPAVATGRNIANRWPPRWPSQVQATVVFLVPIILMVLAEDYLDRALGVVA